MPEEAKLGHDTRDPRQWGWVEPTVWSERMLAALVNGVTVRPLDADWQEVRVKVADTQQLRNWLGSLGTHGVVLAPRSLREEMRATFGQLAALYEESGQGQGPG